jgi:hypothetical protein
MPNTAPSSAAPNITIMPASIVNRNSLRIMVLHFALPVTIFLPELLELVWLIRGRARGAVNKFPRSKCGAQITEVVCGLLLSKFI